MDARDVDEQLGSQQAELTRMLEAIAADLGGPQPELEIVRSPCNGPGLSDKERVELYHNGSLDDSVEFLDTVHRRLDDEGWDYEDSASGGAQHVYANRSGLRVEVGLLAAGTELSLVGRSECI